MASYACLYSFSVSFRIVWLFSCCLLFLPAAGLYEGDNFYQFNSLALLWSGTSASSAEVGPRAFRLTFGSFVQIPLAIGRKDGYSVRLASREDCLVVMSVVFSLLFLPAGQQGFCWSSTLTGYVGYAYVVRHFVTMVYPWGGVIDRLPIRLASRLGLSGCAVFCSCPLQVVIIGHR